MLAYWQAFVLMSPGWFQNTQLLDESSSWPTRQPSLTLRGAVCCLPVAGLEWPVLPGHTGLGSDSDLVRGHSANAERIYLSQVPGIPYAKLDRNGGDDGKGTLSNFPLPIIWKNSSQFVIDPQFANL